MLICPWRAYLSHKHAKSKLSLSKKFLDFLDAGNGAKQATRNPSLGTHDYDDCVFARVVAVNAYKVI